MPEPAVTPNDPSAEITIDLRDRWFAAFLAWLFPGAGHFYQRRWGKGWLFCICIMGTFCSGMYFGGGKVVYAAWGPTSEQKRLYYFLQIGAGAPALPALLQAQRDPPHPTKETGFWRRFMAPPYTPPEKSYKDEDGFVYRDELAKWHHVYGDGFEMGTIYTAIAGLLNLLVVFDAWGGPLMIRADDKKKKPEPDPADKPPGGKPPTPGGT